MTLTIKRPPLVQVKRTAHAIRNGQAILDIVLANRDALVAAAKEGVAPVTAISRELQDHFPVDIKLSPTRQFVGSAIKAVLADAGFEVEQTGVRLPRDPVFTTGAVYREIAAKKDKEHEVVREAYAALVKGLSPTQRRILRDVLQVAMGDM